MDLTTYTESRENKKYAAIDAEKYREERLFAADKLITYLVILFVGALALIYAVIVYNIYTVGFTFKADTEIDGPGQIGDLVGGISAPIIGLIGAMLTFLAFWIQYSFNRYQTIKIEQQGKEADRNRFEGLFYEMIRIHRENVSEITIKNVSKNRRAFISMFKEFKFCYYVLINVYNKYKLNQPDFYLDDQKLVNIGFITFFFGLGESSEDIVNSLLVHYKEDFRNQYYKALEDYREEWLTLEEQINSDRINSGGTRSGKKLTLSVELENKKVFTLTAGYKPFAGHLGRLGHYFRHLYQMVDFIERQNPANKTEYIRTLRAQVSAHEQLLLYYNSLTFMGKPWWEKGYIQNYKIIKNIPLPLANIEPLPTRKLPETYFEWHEITESLDR